MKKLKKDWKTTSAGIIMIAGAIVRLAVHDGAFTEELIMGAIIAIVGGIGLILAQDASVSGGDIKP
jgi:hypothetical protein